MSNLVIGPAKIAIPISGANKHKTINLNKQMGAYIIECGKNESGKTEYFVVLNQTFCEASSDTPIESSFAALTDLPDNNNMDADKG